MVTLFKGLILADLITDPEVDKEALSQFPGPVSWRRIGEEGVKPTGQFLWTARPPGIWVAFMRYGVQLIVSSAVVPLDVNYEVLYEMLGQDEAVLLARCSDETGLIAVAAKQPGQSYLPLMPGFTAGVMVDPTTVDSTGTEKVEQRARDWPEGLHQPEIIHMQAAQSLLNPEHRQHWLKEYTEGYWLLTVVNHLRIYEVLS